MWDVFRLHAVLADEKIPPLAFIPNNLYSPEKIEFSARRQALQGQLHAFQAAAKVFNETPAESQTDADFNSLQAQRAAYVDAANAFNRDLATAKTAADARDALPVCPPGSSVVGSGCMRDTFIRPAPSNKEKLAALRRQAQRELDEIRFHGFLISWEGVWTILSKTQVPEASSTAEDESNEMSKNVKAYLELEEQIEELTGDKAAAERRLAERESRIKYVRTDGSYNVNLSKSAAPGQNISSQ